MKKGRPENLKKINDEIKGMKAALGVLPKEMAAEIKEQFGTIGIWADYVILYIKNLKDSSANTLNFRI